MAEFGIREVEGMRQLRIDIRDEAVRAVAGALSHMSGNIRMTVPLPSPMTMLRSLISPEPLIRPRYQGTGAIFLEPSLGGYHVFDARSRHWILEPGAFWAAEGEIRLSISREPFLSAFWAGDGLLKFVTHAEGEGKLVIRAPGPVEEIDIQDEEVVVQGRLVLGRTAGLRYRVRRPAGFFRSFLSGEPLVRCYSGTGKALVCWTPYWNQYIHERMTGEAERLE
jgi:uncharacterized protein (AIM24 family)